MEQRTMLIVTVVLVVVVAFLGAAIVAGLYLTGGEEYTIVVAKSDLPSNTRIQARHLETKTVEEPPGSAVIQDTGEIEGMITARSISAGSTFTPRDLTDQFRVVRTTRSIPPGNRIQSNMIETARVDQAPPGAISNPDRIMNKMVREGIPSGTVIRSTDVYMEEQTLVVARERIPANSMIREEQLRTVTRPTGPPDAVSEPDKVVGRAVKRELMPGDVVRQSDLFPDEQQLSYFIPLYKRATSIPVSNYNNLSYLIRPGDRIDLYAYLQQGPWGKLKVPGGDGNGQGQGQSNDFMTGSFPTLQKVADGAEILSLNDVFRGKRIKQIESGGEDGESKEFTYQNMTLAVTLWEAEKINLLRGMKQAGQGDIRFFVILRPRQLKSQYGSRHVNTLGLFNRRAGQKQRRLAEEIMNQVYEYGHKQARQNDQNREHIVEVIQGTKKESVAVPSYK